MGKFKNALIVEIKEAHERATSKNISRQSDDDVEDVFQSKEEYEDYLRYCNEVHQFGDKGGV